MPQHQMDGNTLATKAVKVVSGSTETAAHAAATARSSQSATTTHHARDGDEIDPTEAQRRMDEAVKRMLSMPPETHDEMVKRKHRKGEIKAKPRG